MNYNENFDQYLNKALVNYDMVGVTVGVWVDDQAPLDSAGLTYEKALGKADMATGLELDTKQYSHMASISKTFTACSILKLVGEGKLSLDDKLSDVLPFVKMRDARYKDITVKHLITHTAGLPAVKDFHWTNPDIDSEALKRYALSDDVKNAQFVNSPGDNNFSYSDMGFEILGNIIQEVSGMAYEEFIANKLLRPCGMYNSTMLLFERTGTGQTVKPDLATREEISQILSMGELLDAGLVMPHKKNENKEYTRQSYYPYNRRHAPSSTLNTNIFDIKKWGDAHMKRSVLDLKAYEDMWKVQTIVPNNGEGMGYGWFIRVQNGYTLYGHEGMDDGFRASFWICPELKTQIVVLANVDRAPVKKISRDIFNIITLNE